MGLGDTRVEMMDLAGALSIPQPPLVGLYLFGIMAPGKKNLTVDKNTEGGMWPFVWNSDNCCRQMGWERNKTTMKNATELVFPSHDAASKEDLLLKSNQKWGLWLENHQFLL